MRFSSIARASIVPLAAMALATDGATASVNYNSSKSNSGNFTFDPKTDLGAAKQCADGGGTVKSGPGQVSTCVMPNKPASAPK